MIVLDIGLPDISGYDVAGSRIDHHMLKPVDPEGPQTPLAAVPDPSSA